MTFSALSNQHVAGAEERAVDLTTASSWQPFCVAFRRKLEVAAFFLGYIALVKDGRSLGRLHAVIYWKGGTTGGKFNGIRIHPSSGRSKDLHYARLLLVFSATLSDSDGIDRA
jgi:hypothetical protein